MKDGIIGRLFYQGMGSHAANQDDVAPNSLIPSLVL